MEGILWSKASALEVLPLRRTCCIFVPVNELCLQTHASQNPIAPGDVLLWRTSLVEVPEALFEEPTVLPALSVLQTVAAHFCQVASASRFVQLGVPVDSYMIEPVGVYTEKHDQHLVA